MKEQPTCGQGLAEHSGVPAKIGALLGSLAENLDAHIPTLDLDDPHALEERIAYVSLSGQFHDLARRLLAVSTEMAGYRDLPLARHHEHALRAPNIAEAFRNFVRKEDEAVHALEESLQRDQALLQLMAGTGT